MGKIWLNLYSNPAGTWIRGEVEVIEHRAFTEDLGGATVRIFETARSGSMTLTPVGAELVSYGDAEVYLKIRFRDGSSKFLSAPLTTAVEVGNVQSIELATLVVVGNPAAERVVYRGAVNAHCVYEVVEGTAGPIVDQSNLVSSGNLVVNSAQSVGQAFTVSRSGRLVGIEVALLRCSATAADTIMLEVRQGSTSLGSTTLTGAGIPGPGLCGVVPAPLDISNNGPGYFDLSALGLSVIAGQSYSFRLSNASSADFRAGTSANVYAGGTGMVNASPFSGDLAFKILIAP